MATIHLKDVDSSKEPEFIRLKGKTHAGLMKRGAAKISTPLEHVLSQETARLIKTRLSKLFPRQKDFIRKTFELEGQPLKVHASVQLMNPRKDWKRFTKDDVLRGMRNRPEELIEATGAPKLMHLDCRLDHIIFLTDKIPVVIDGFHKQGIETVGQLRKAYHEQLATYRTLESIDIDMTEFLKGQFYEESQKPSARPTNRFTYKFQAFCKLAKVKPENAVSRYPNRKQAAFRHSPV